mmetsp:Transcript_5644/g.14953  ORF Transcript_5644/g.14953 Transcript_5644/m.14953 type:complete len:257 (+) Transcript_5644:179-949(+)
MATHHTRCNTIASASLTLAPRSNVILRRLVLVTLFAWASSAAKHNGKTFSATGTWRLSREYIQQNRCANSTHSISALDCTYKLDSRLANCLAHFFRGHTITELGSGVGRYKRAVDATGLAGEYVAYDGLTNVAELTRGQVSFADLTVNNPQLRRSDFALSLEVAEHIPKPFEAILMRNIDRSNTMGIVISWSNMGSSQSNHGHVNPKRKSQVRQLFAPWGYVEDRNASAYLRTCATFLYLKRGVQVMRKLSNNTAF